MNFGAFAGGFAHGLESGMRIGKSVRDIIREKKIEDLQEQGMAEAKAAREQAVNGMISENKDTEQPKSGTISEDAKPSTKGTPSTVVNESMAKSPTRSPDEAGARSAETTFQGGASDAPAAAAMATPSNRQGLLLVAGEPGQKIPGIVEYGNIDINKRKVLQNPDGSISTERSITIGIDGGKQVLIPTIIDGKLVSDEEAKAHFAKTGENLGIFDTPENANAYAEMLHKRQEQVYGSGAPAPAGGSTAPAEAPQAEVRPANPPQYAQAAVTGSDASTAPAAATPQTAAANGVPGMQKGSDVMRSGQATQPAPAPAAAAPAAATPAAAPPAAPAEPVKIQGKYVVNGKGYATQAEARKAAEAATPSEMEYFMRNGVPKIAQQYLAQGDPVKAEAWTKYAETHQAQQNMKEWASMYRAAQMGDMEKAADHAFKLYQKYEDGVTPLSKETVKDKDGNVTGFNVRLKNDATGEVTAQFIDRKAMIEMGAAALSPPQMFEMMWKRQEATDKAILEAKVKRGEKAAEFQEKVLLQNNNNDRADARELRKGNQRLSEISLKAQLDEAKLGSAERAKAQTKIDMLKESGYTDEQISGMMPGIVGAGDHKKITDPTERRALIFSDLTKNDPSFARMPKDKQEERIKQAMDVIYGENTPAKPAGDKGAAAPAAKPTGNAAFDAAKEGAQFKNSAGDVYEKRNGVPVLIRKAQPTSPQAGGMPQR